MSLSQLGRRVSKTAQGVRALEQREKSGGITLQSLKEIAEALDMQLVYAIVPKKGTLKEMVDAKALEKARMIVDRTNITMDLEQQGLQQDRLLAIVNEKKEELKNEMPKFLWD
jgi:predicted DNA-binding mobile mystery protein A